jgi:hypothetical protein
MPGSRFGFEALEHLGSPEADRYWVHHDYMVVTEVGIQ